MKKRLNIITLLLFFAFGFHSSHFLGEEWYSLKTGIKEGHNRQSPDAIKEHVFLTLFPKEHGVLVDSVYNEKSNTWLPARIQTMEVIMKQDSPNSMLLNAVIFASAFILIGALIMVIICFTKLIMSINKSIIFDKKNIKRLRLIGIGLLLIFLYNFILELFQLRMARDMIAIPGYTISSSNVAAALNLILGIISFLVAEIFAIGLRLKEDQEFTI